MKKSSKCEKFVFVFVDKKVSLRHTIGMIDNTVKGKYRPLLNQVGLKATPERLSILHVLHKAKKPLSVKELRDKLKNSDVDQATIYRNMESLLKNKLIQLVNFQHDHNHYEIIDETHHHHVICEKCAKIVDVSKCDTSKLEREIQTLSGFDSINSHALEFFGICNRCASKKL